jgi:hypothetical protein
LGSATVHLDSGRSTAAWNALCTLSQKRVVACALEDDMRFGWIVLLVASLTAVPAAARAQDFGVLESAETIDQGNFKFETNSQRR